MSSRRSGRPPRLYKAGYSNDELREAYEQSEQRSANEGTVERDFGDPERFDPRFGNVQASFRLRLITHTDAVGREYQMTDPSVHELRTSNGNPFFVGHSIILNVRLPRTGNTYERLSTPGQEQQTFPFPGERLVLTITQKAAATGKIPHLIVEVNEREEKESATAMTCALHCTVLSFS